MFLYNLHVMEKLMSDSKRVLGVFALAMITVAAIVSLRNLPLSAEFGFSAVFYLVIAAIVFFIPIAYVTAELASLFPRSGGCYTWVSEAFGKPTGFLALWFAWMESIAWFPAILAFTTAMFAHMLAPLIPGLENNKTFVVIFILLTFWGATFSNFLGIKISGWVSSWGVIIGTLIPGMLIIFLGFWWVISGKQSAIIFSFNSLIPDFDLSSIVIFSGVLLALAGVEIAAFHIKDAKKPQKYYPLAIIIASVVILGVYILGTLAIAIVVPQKEISLASGMIQAFNVFFNKVGLAWIVPFMALFLFLGSLAGINTWTVGPAKGMLVVAEDGFFPPILKKVNKHGVPTSLLLLQAVVGSILSLVFLYMDSKSAGIWILTALSAQFTFVQYLLVFLAALWLRYSKPNLKRSFKTPFILLNVVVGVLTCIFSFLIVYIPPRQLNVGDANMYRILLIISFVLLTLPPYFMVKLHKKESKLH